MSEYRLAREIEAAALLRDRFKEAFVDDEEALADMAEGETELFETMEKVLDTLASDESMIVGIEARIAALKERVERFSRRIELKRTLLLTAMQTAEVKSREFAEVTISRKTLPDKPIVTEEADVPASWFEPQAPKLNRAKIAAHYRERIKALKEAEAIADPGGRQLELARINRDMPELPGVTISNGGESVTIKWK